MTRREEEGQGEEDQDLDTPGYGHATSRARNLLSQEGASRGEAFERKAPGVSDRSNVHWSNVKGEESDGVETFGLSPVAPSSAGDTVYPPPSTLHPEP